MGQRNILCTSQMLDGEIHQLGGQHHLHPEPCFFLGNIADFPRPNVYTVLSASGNASNIDNGMYFGAQYNSLPHHHHPMMANLDFGGVPVSNFYDPYMIPFSGRRNFPVPLNHGPTDQLPGSSNQGMSGINLGEYEGNNHFMDGVRGSCKRKNAEGFPRNSQHANGSTSSGSSSAGTSSGIGRHHWEQQLESGVQMHDPAALPPPEFGGNGTLSVAEGGPQRSVRSRSSPIGLQREPPLLHNTNNLIQGNFIGQSFQPACSTLVEQQFGTNGMDGRGLPTWSCAPTLPYLHGRNVSGGSLEMGGMAAPGYQDSTNGANSAVFFYPSSTSHQHSQQHNDHHHPPPPQVQGMPSHNLSYHPQAATPSYWHPLNNTFHHSGLNLPQGDTVPGAGYPRPVLPSGFRIYRPHRRAVQPAVPEDGHRSRLRILPEDEVAILDFSGFGSFSDHHSDMRLDIDHMSYEELLALEERIGNVKVGLTDESIIKHLNTRYHVSPPTCINLEEPFNMDQDSEACIICQDEYENMDQMGTLDCGHEYHAECIRKWLLVKNVCPICKIQALSVDCKDG